MRALLASPLGFLVGVSLGALGGGGSILAVPALVYAAGQSPKQATTTSLVLVTISALIGLLPHWRARRVRLLSGTLFGLVGIAGSLVGSHFNAVVNPDVLLLGFAVLTLIAAAAMWRRARTGPRSVSAAASPTAIATMPLDAAAAVRVVLAGVGVGLLTGFFGVGGGFVIVPALVLILRFDMPAAVGTSLLVIAINSMAALSTRLGNGTIVWSTVIPFTVASLLGVVVGARLAHTRDPVQLQRWFVAVLVAVGIYTAIRSALALI
ncbi:MAG TPA: sulfite exporter TauE/SafE family protein [Ilumatobacteraceae bacterium]|nr:sulfite exporter TauE/SafE family protein [Ilumatobacteraceae bacterium]